MPRQIPSSGRSRASARRASASSKASRSGRVPRVSACGSALVGWVDVGAASQQQPVEPVEQQVGVGDHSRIGRQDQRHPAGRARRWRRRAAPAPPRSRPGPQEACSIAPQMPMAGWRPINVRPRIELSSTGAGVAFMDGTVPAAAPSGGKTPRTAGTLGALT
ncbi:MAG: hypothetical protein U0R26_11720 [Solirubrobacterales bacterium]